MFTLQDPGRRRKYTNCCFMLISGAQRKLLERFTSGSCGSKKMKTWIETRNSKRKHLV
jgi:hypothetical protein